MCVCVSCLSYSSTHAVFPSANVSTGLASLLGSTTEVLQEEGTVVLRDTLSDVISWFDCGMFPTGCFEHEIRSVWCYLEGCGRVRW